MVAVNSNEKCYLWELRDGYRGNRGFSVRTICVFYNIAIKLLSYPSSVFLSTTNANHLTLLIGATEAALVVYRAV